MELGAQTTLFDAPTVAEAPPNPRYYQDDAYHSVFKHLSLHRSTLVVFATALGKTQLFSMVARDWGGDVLVLVHRDELLHQARRRLELLTGERVEVEKAEYRSYRARIVVGSVQSLTSAMRLKRLGKDRFSLIVADEAHHSVSPSWRRVFDFFCHSKVLGVTATPDRLDNSALGKVFDSTAYVMDILEGIDQGWLTPIDAHSVTLDYDASDLKKIAGDISATQLEEKLLGVCNAIVDDVIRNAPGMQGILFFPGVKSAQYAAARFNSKLAGSAICIHEKTDKNLRREMVDDFRAGKYLYLTNAEIATEGFDAPEVRLIGIARLTMSRLLYTQMVGRGLRAASSAQVDAFPGRHQSSERLASIAWSAKPTCMIRDYVGVGSRHTLCTPHDILGGSYSVAERKRASRIAKEISGGDPREHLERARKELKKIASVQQTTTQHAVPYDPFQVFHLRTPDDDPIMKKGFSPPTQKQLAVLRKAGIPESEISEMNLSKRSATRLITNIMIRLDKKLADYGQLRALQAWGVSNVNISKKNASAALRYIASTNHGRTSPIDLKKLTSIARGRTQK